METENKNDSPATQGEEPKANQVNIPEISRLMLSDKENVEFEGRSGFISVCAMGTEDGYRVGISSSCDFDKLPLELATPLELALKLACNLISSTGDEAVKYMKRYMKRKVDAGIKDFLEAMAEDEDCTCEACAKRKEADEKGGSHE